MTITKGKRYRAAAEAVGEGRTYTPQEAVALAKRVGTAKFDETVELHFNTSADPRHADQQVRGVAILPHGLGKPIRVAVFAQGEAVRTAEQAGADIVGSDDLAERIEGGFLDFDITIATPDLMGRIGRLGRILGRRGLMPNPRTGTVVQPEDLPRAIGEAKKGRTELRMDRTANIHTPIGKVSFDDSRLLENMAAVVDTVNRLKPVAIKGQYIRSAYLTTAMGPSIPLDLASTLSMKLE